MWIPTPIYEALPYAYILGGVLFITGTLYIGLTAPGAALYVACGLLSTLYGLFIFSVLNGELLEVNFPFVE